MKGGMMQFELLRFEAFRSVGFRRGTLSASSELDTKHRD
jgi:hypothetical protein